jgi:hypothetical protein
VQVHLFATCKHLKFECVKVPGGIVGEVVPVVVPICIVAFAEGSSGLSQVPTTFTAPDEGVVNVAVYGFVENGWTAITVLLNVAVAKNNPEVQPLSVQLHWELGAQV